MSSSTEKVGARIDSGLANRLRNAVYMKSGPPRHLTIRSVLEKGIQLVLDEIEEEDGEIGDRPEEAQRLRGGRRVRPPEQKDDEEDQEE